jgi:hypothetical protein
LEVDVPENVKRAKKAFSPLIDISQCISREQMHFSRKYEKARLGY